jgi:small conductance mechanosensitive channel
MLLAQIQWSQLGEEAKALLIRYGVSALGALVLLVIAWTLSGWISRALERGMTRAKIDATLTRFLARLVGWLVLLMAVLACLSIFGVETTSFAAVLGAAGIAIGLAFQGTLSNFASGLMLLVFRPFQVGDTITVASVTGKVYAIEIFTTTVDTADNRRYIIPNSSVFGATIENITFHPQRRIDLTIGVGYDADIDQTRSVLESAVAQVEAALSNPAPAVILSELGASSVNWIVQVWANSADLGAVKQALLRAIKNSLDAAGIEIPYPQMDVHLRQSADAANG